MKHIRAITFDLDNTLWETDRSILGAERTMADHLSSIAPAAWMAEFSIETFRQARAQVLARHPELSHRLTESRRATLAHWFREQGANEQTAKDLAHEGFQAFYRARQQVELYPGTAAVLAKLATRFPLGAITNGNADVLAMPIGTHFQFAYQAERFPRAKPHPDMFMAALETLGIEAHACLHVGDDLEHDVLGAQAVGMTTAWLNLSGHRQPEASADLILNRLEDLLTHLMPHD